MRLNLALSEACTKLSVPKPWLVIRPGTTPNTRSFGILGKLAVLQIEQGLLDTVSGDRELAAVLAHEVAHLRRFDTLFFTVVGPLISLARLSLGLMMGGGMVLQRIGRSMAGAFSPATSLARMQRAGVVGIIVMFAVVMTIMMLAAYLMMFAFVAVLVVGGLAVGGLAWSRHAESAADACAANALGNPDGLLTALAWCVDQFPSQRADIERFMLSCGSSGNYGLADVIRCIKNGGSVVSSDSRLQRLLATHPTVLKRIAVLLVRCKTQIA
jgi:Zn-dependent protease with chaperone function